MSQIFGVVDSRAPSRVAHLIKTMGWVQQRPNQAPAELWADTVKGVGLGRLFTREVGRLARFGDAKGQSGVWLLDGEIYGLSAAARTGLRPLEPDDAPERFAEAIPSLYERFGSDFPSHLDGSFCVALYDERRQTLILATDRFSTRTFYWAQAGGALLFASELKALLAAPSLSRTIDVQTLSECFAFNRTLGERTLLEAVRRLAPATVLEFDIASRSVKQHAYWQPDDDLHQRLPLSPGRLEAIAEAFCRAVRLRTAGPRRVGVSLSAGLDSRAIVSVIAGDRRAASTCTTGIEGCSDQRLARRLARLSGTSHTFYPLTQQMIRGYLAALRKAILLTDGMVLVGGFPAGLTQLFCDEHRIEMLLRGHGGENARLAEAWPFQATRNVLEMGGRRDLGGFLQTELRTMPRQVDWQRLFPAGGTKPSEERASASLSELLAAYPPGLTAAETMNALYLTQNDAIGPPATRAGLRGHAEMGLPYLDYTFMSLVLATDARERCGAAIHHAIIRRTAPALMKVPNSNTGAPLDASPLRLALTDKFNSLMRRLQLPGFRHYHYMEQWIKNFLAEQVRAILLDERTLSRGLYDRGYLTQLVDRSRGDASMSRLLNLIVNLEIWFRLFCDGEALSGHET